MMHVISAYPGTHCLEAQLPPKETGLEILGWDGEVVDFNSKVTYKCQSGKKFTDDFDQASVQAECLPDNMWSLPADWGECVESKICTFHCSK